MNDAGREGGREGERGEGRDRERGRGGCRGIRMGVRWERMRVRRGKGNGNIIIMYNVMCLISSSNYFILYIHTQCTGVV